MNNSMFSDSFDKPTLTENNFMDYLQNSLKSCHENRTRIYSIVLNVGIVVLLFLIIGGFLYYRYKTRPTPYEQQQKLYEDQQHVLNRIRYYQAQQKNIMTSPIGNL